MATSGTVAISSPNTTGIEAWATPRMASAGIGPVASRAASRTTNPSTTSSGQANPAHVLGLGWVRPTAARMLSLMASMVRVAPQRISMPARPATRGWTGTDMGSVAASMVSGTATSAVATV